MIVALMCAASETEFIDIDVSKVDSKGGVVQVPRVMKFDFWRDGQLEETLCLEFLVAFIHGLMEKGAKHVVIALVTFSNIDEETVELMGIHDIHQIVPVPKELYR